MAGLHYDSLADLPPKFQAQAGGKMMKANKYRNEKTTVAGIRFDSKREAARFQELREAQSLGIISDLQLQRDFTLQEAYTLPNGDRIRAIRYRADFVYIVARTEFTTGDVIAAQASDLAYWKSAGAGTQIIEDAKGARTREYILKKKLMAGKGYQIREV